MALTPLLSGVGGGKADDSLFRVAVCRLRCFSIVCDSSCGNELGQRMRVQKRLAQLGTWHAHTAVKYPGVFFLLALDGRQDAANLLDAFHRLFLRLPTSYTRA